MLSLEGIFSFGGRPCTQWSGHFNVHPFDLIGVDMQNVIFSFLTLHELSRTALVCHSWARNMRRYCAHLRQLRLGKVSDKQLNKAAAACPALTHINLEGYNRRLRSVASLAQHCSALRSIDMDSCWNVSSASLIQVAQRCSSLQSLRVVNCEVVTDDVLISLCTVLDVLDIGGCNQFSDTGLCTLVRKQTELTMLSLYDCQQLTNVSFNALGAHLPVLRELDLCYCHIDDPALCQIAQHCPLLTHLSLKKCILLTDTSICTLAAHCNFLTNLDIGWIPSLTDTSVCQIALRCTRLQMLDIMLFNINGTSLFTLASHCPQLSKLICHKDTWTRSSLLAVVRACPMLKGDVVVPKGMIDPADYNEITRLNDKLVLWSV